MSFLKASVYYKKYFFNDFKKLFIFALLAIGFGGAPGASVLSGSASYVCARNFYVDGAAGSDTANSGSQTSPWKTIQFANDSGRLWPGDCVNVAAGTYVQSGGGGIGLMLNRGGNSNTTTGYVAYIGAANHTTHITGNPDVFNLVRIPGSYIILDGFDLDGTSTQDYVVSNNPVAQVTAGHHLMILNNLIHESGGGGVGFAHSDYFTIFGNKIYNTCGKNPTQESGISIYEPQPVANFHSTLIADTAPFHIEIANNFVYDNAESNAIPSPHSDGNGIIIDDWLDTQEPPFTAYPYQGLVQSNLVTGNGGKGIQVYLSANVTIANNTVFNNNLDKLNNGTWRGELNNAASHTISWFNNIAWSVPIADDPVLKYNTAVLMATYANYSQANVAFTSNLSFNGQNGIPGASLPNAALLAAFAAQNKAGVNPLLDNKLQPKGSSPALASGVPTPNFPPVSLWGNFMKSPPDIGAY